MQQMTISQEALKVAKVKTAPIHSVDHGFTVDGRGRVFFLLFIRGFYLRHIVFEDTTIRPISGDIPSPDEEVTLLMDPRVHGLTKVVFAPKGTCWTS